MGGTEGYFIFEDDGEDPLLRKIELKSKVIGKSLGLPEKSIALPKERDVVSEVESREFSELKSRQKSVFTDV